MSKNNKINFLIKKFYYLIFSCDEELFKVMQDSQKLCINFKEYSGLNKKLFNNCITEPHWYILYSFNMINLVSLRFL